MGVQRVSQAGVLETICFYGLWGLMETPGKMDSSDGLAKHWAFWGIQG